MNPPRGDVFIVDGGQTFAWAFLAAFPHAHERISRWIIANHDRTRGNIGGFELSRFPDDFTPDEDDAELFERIMRRHWLDFSLIAMRDSKVSGLEHRVWVSSLVLRAIALVRDVQRRGARLCFIDLPHNTLSFSVLATAFEIGLAYDVCIASTVDYLGNVLPSPFPFEPVSDAAVRDVAWTGALSAPGAELVRRLRGGYATAKPGYIPQQLKQRSLLGLVARSLKNARSPTLGGAQRYVRRALLRRSYGSRAAPPPPAPFIYVPLHYQPERTTLPQGRLFVDQEMMVQRLAKMAPPGMSLAVREHPSTFTLGGPVWRTDGAYERLRALPGVSLCSVDADPFDLLDRAVAVATVCGTVALEAAARQKPTIIFGAPTYVGLPGMFEVTTLPSLPAAPAADDFERWLARYEKSALSVASASAPLEKDEVDFSGHASVLLSLLFPERVIERDAIRRVEHSS